MLPEGQTDLANARRFARRHGQNAHYCHRWSKWLTWDESRWAIDDDGTVMRLAKTVPDEIWAESRKYDSTSVLKFAARTAQDRNIKAFLSLAQSELAVQPEDLDQDPWLLNCPNGTVDLRHWRTRAHRSRRYAHEGDQGVLRPGSKLLCLG